MSNSDRQCVDGLDELNDLLHSLVRRAIAVGRRRRVSRELVDALAAVRTSVRGVNEFRGNAMRREVVLGGLWTRIATLEQLLDVAEQAVTTRPAEVEP